MLKLEWLIDHPDYKVPMPEQVGATKSIQAALDRGERGHGLFMDGGTGKTLVAYNLFLNLRRAGIVKQMQVEAPNFAKGVWREHLEYCGKAAKGLTIRVWPEEPNGADIFVYNYEMTQHPSKAIPLGRVLSTPSLFVPDESHRGKNFKSRQARSMMEVGKAATFTLPMTGTPMGESVLDLWPQLRCMGAISGTTPMAFRNEYAVLGGYMGKKIVGVKNEPQLNQLLDRFSYRATLSSRTEHVYGEVHAEMTKTQSEAYMTMYRERFLPMIEGEVSADMVITMLTKMQQIACGYVIDNERITHELVPVDKNPRIKALKDALEDVEGKSILFTHSKYSTQALAKFIDKAVYLEGGMNELDIQKRKDAFNKDPAIRRIIAPVQMAKESITLLGNQDRERDACRSTFFYETSYSRIGRTQAEWRNSRKGQRYPVRYWDFRSTSNLGRGVLDVDKRSGEALRKKQDMVTAFRTTRSPD